MMQAMSVAPEPSRAGYDRREHRPGLARAHASACASAKQRSQLRCANATCGAGPCGRYGCYGNGDLWVSGGCRMEFRCGRSRGLCGDYRSPQEVYCSCSMFRPSGLDLPPLRELPCSINTNASRAAKALMTPQQSEALMERVGSDKAAYFEQVRSLTGLTTRPRDQFEVEVKGREQRCLSQGRFFVFGDSVARELAERIAQLRGVNTTSQETTACSTTDIFYAFAMRNQATSYLPQQGQLLPHQRLPCKPDWVVYSYGVHHLRAQGSVTYPTCTTENGVCWTECKQPGLHHRRLPTVLGYLCAAAAQGPRPPLHRLYHHANRAAHSPGRPSRTGGTSQMPPTQTFGCRSSAHSLPHYRPRGSLRCWTSVALRRTMLACAVTACTLRRTGPSELTEGRGIPASWRKSSAPPRLRHMTRRY